MAGLRVGTVGLAVKIAPPDRRDNASAAIVSANIPSPPVWHVGALIAKLPQVYAIAVLRAGTLVLQQQAHPQDRPFRPSQHRRSGLRLMNIPSPSF